MATEDAPRLIPQLLPHDKIYTIQVGDKSFHISGLLLSSDGPSYFTNYFQTDNFQPLFIDRNPGVFEIIYKHLQGYSFEITCDTDFCDLWLDSFYFGLLRLQDLLRKDAFHARVGGEWIRLPRELLAKNSPNFFTVSYEALFASQETLIDRGFFLRPPAQRASTVECRLPQLLRDLLEVLRGNTAVITDDNHRSLLLAECRYYRFLELEQRLLKFHIVQSDGPEEILIGLAHLNRKGIQKAAIIQYARPYITEPHRNLLIEVKVEQSDVVLDSFRTVRFSGKTHRLLRHLLDEILREDAKDELELEVINVGKGTVDGCEYSAVDAEGTKRRRLDGSNSTIVLRRSIWRFHVSPESDNVSCRLVLFEGVQSMAPQYRFLE